MSDRYIRQHPIIGIDGQNKLNATKVLVIGCGGIGSPLAMYLTSCGVGTIAIVDDDYVELSNLHRQVIYRESDIGGLKTSAVFRELKERNNLVDIEVIENRLDLSLALALFPSYDLIIDGSDNYETRYLVNDVCCKYGKTFISCAISGDSIQLAAFDTNKLCYRCFFPAIPPGNMILNCKDSGVIGAVSGIAGTLCANFAINLLLNRVNCVQSMYVFNSIEMNMEKLPLIKNDSCPSCVQKLIDEELYDNVGISFSDLKKMDDFVLIDIREEKERFIDKLAGDLHIPLSEIERIYEQPKNKVLILYCHSDQRSRHMVRELRGRGYTAFYLKGGLSRVKGKSCI